MKIKLKDWAKTSFAIDVFKNKYKDGDEKFLQSIKRISGGDKFIEECILAHEFFSGGRIAANRGLGHLKNVCYSNCFVNVIKNDSIEGIFDCAKQMARTFSTGGGVGIDLSVLSPRGSAIRNAAKTTTGATSFMKLYGMTSEVIGAEGRRAALMMSLDCHHPDLLEFIDIKQNISDINEANISVRFTDDFMNAVVEDKKFKLSFTRSETGQTIEKEVLAKDVFMKLSKNNWETGEPGCLFWDRIEDYNLLSKSTGVSFAGTNPCGEQPLMPFGSCLLGAINLAEFAESKENISKGKYIKTKRLKEVVRGAVTYLNEVLDEGIQYLPLKEQQETCKKWRQIGLGIMGWADFLIKVEVKYNSKQALMLADKIGDLMAKTAIEQSSFLAKKNGAYPGYDDGVLDSTFFKAHATKKLTKMVKKYGLRNSSLLTIAPTGSISSLFNVSGGMEPIFANSYIRETKSLHNQSYSYKIYTHIVEEYMKAHNIKDEYDLPDYFVTASDISYKDRIAMQSVWQKHIDSAISSTVNLPQHTSVEDVFNLYIEAWKMGLKGVTIFRDGCSRKGILTKESEDKPLVSVADVKMLDTKTEESTQPPITGKQLLSRGDLVRVYDDVVGKKRKLMTGCGTLHTQAWFDPEDSNLYETFFAKGSTGGCNSWMNFASRLISLVVRYGGTVDAIVDQALSCPSCPSYTNRRALKHDVSPGNCCPAAVGLALKEMNAQNASEYDAAELVEDDFDDDPLVDAVNLQDAPKGKCKTCEDQRAFEEMTEFLSRVEVEKESNNMGICPECGKKTYIAEGGCGHCVNDDCGFSGCD